MQHRLTEWMDLSDVQRWQELAARDPAAFEALRERVIDAYIASVPEHQQRRLRGLQWQIDCVRRRTGNPLGSCMAISNMMWDSLQRLETLCRALPEDIRRITAGDAPPVQRQATVLPFRSCP